MHGLRGQRMNCRKTSSRCEGWAACWRNRRRALNSGAKSAKEPEGWSAKGGSGSAGRSNGCGDRNISTESRGKRGLCDKGVSDLAENGLVLTIVQAIYTSSGSKRNV